MNPHAKTYRIQLLVVMLTDGDGIGGLVDVPPGPESTVNEEKMEGRKLQYNFEKVWKY